MARAKTGTTTTGTGAQDSSALDTQGSGSSFDEAVHSPSLPSQERKGYGFKVRVMPSMAQRMYFV